MSRLARAHAQPPYLTESNLEGRSRATQRAAHSTTRATGNNSKRHRARWLREPTGRAARGRATLVVAHQITGGDSTLAPGALSPRPGSGALTRPVTRPVAANCASNVPTSVALTDSAPYARRSAHHGRRGRVMVGEGASRWASLGRHGCEKSADGCSALPTPLADTSAAAARRSATAVDRD
jgi:hypothetical protein